ncbi:hypothetical protein G15_1319 [Enterococcus avium]|jgi:hypothetical protein|uniref:hypothetical protein n=1 Tax=Enterococcus TaxID=1350 RepID=UPI0015975264|nr:hypothetical protein [Enterococcus gilvus]BBM17674.1 hypothetical protein G15_1319 [Enterococcus avium]DAL95807.1 MAG TPA: hypothetical protein [Caudoviricetes sp.]
MDKKLVLKAEKESKATMPVFIDTEQHQKLLALKAETGIPLRRLVEKFIEYGLDNVVIEGGD